MRPLEQLAGAIVHKAGDCQDWCRAACVATCPTVCAPSCWPSWEALGARSAVTIACWQQRDGGIRGIALAQVKSQLPKAMSRSASVSHRVELPAWP